MAGFLDKLQQRWKLNSLKQTLLVLLTFACAGTTVAYIARMANHWMGFDQNTEWYLKFLVKLFIFLIGYQIVILAYGFLFGQFKFFWNYEKKILNWLGRIFGSSDKTDGIK